MNSAISEQAFAETIGSIYDAALLPDAWPNVLERMAGLFNCHFADLFTRSHDRLRYAGLAHGLDRADYQDLFLDTWFKRNVWGLSRPTRTEGEVLTTRDMLDPAVLMHSEIYTDYLDPRGFHEGLRLALWADRDGIQDISLLRSWSTGAFTGAELELAARLLPHLQRAAAITRRLARDEAASAAGLMGLAAAGLGAILLDAEARPMLLNAVAERILGERDGLFLQGTELRAAMQAANPALKQGIGRAVDANPLTRASSTLRLPRAKGSAALIVVVVPLTTAIDWRLPQHPAALMLFADPATRGPSSAQLTALFGLTQTEADLAENLGEGHDLREIAERQGRSIHTIRNHLARLMSKTATNRQADLARLLRSVPNVKELSPQPDRRILLRAPVEDRQRPIRE